MEVNWTILGILAFCVIIFIALLIRKNAKDKKELTKFLNNDYPKSKEESELNNER